MTAVKDKIGKILIEHGLITPEQLEIALKEQKNRDTKDKIGKILVDKKFITEEELVNALSLQLGIPVVDLNKHEINEEIIKLIPENMIKKYRVIPINRLGNTLIVAMEDPTDLNAIDDIRFYTGYNVDVVIATPSAIKNTIDRLFDQATLLDEISSDFSLEDIDFSDISDEEEVDISTIEKESEKGPVIKLVNYILTEAIKQGASDIHIEPYEKTFRVRFRIDGVLHEFVKPPMKLKNAIISRIKIMAHLNIAERRLPQDGRIKLKLSKNREVDFRVSTLPTLFGEKVVLRILDKSNLQLDLSFLGFEDRELKLFQEAIHKPYGMVLVTGPTGSGKTTTLYSALQELNQVGTNISTAEDPVEYNLEGINQVHIREEIGLTFASALRAFLRQDPDIILVGEIRDLETGEIAVKAALTGHLVLSTLHTNDAPSTVTRLVDMGIEPFLVSSSLLLVVAQRLARKICPNCKKEIKVEKKALISMGVPEKEVDNFKVFKGEGCDKCGGNGYKGRVALYEVLEVTSNIKELINKGATSMEIQEAAKKEGMRTLREIGLIKVNKGITTLEEVGRVTIE